MKKIIVCLFFIACPFFISAEPLESVLGVKLSSTKDEALAVMSAGGWRAFPSQDTENVVSFLKDGGTFGGVIVDGLIIQFENNKVSGFIFSFSRDKSDAVAELCKVIEKKYNAVMVESSDERVVLQLEGGCLFYIWEESDPAAVYLYFTDMESIQNHEAQEQKDIEDDL